jgi:hypothetical protein
MNIDQLTSEVIPEPEPEAGATAGTMAPWETEDQIRGAHGRMARDRARTCAEGFDD